MDIKRNLLILGLAIVSYLMLLAWNEDYPSIPAKEANPVALQAVDLPAPTTGSAEEDLPQVQSVVQQNAQQQQAAVTNGNLITINTPRQDVTIDLYGGDIVRLTLPEFPVSLENQAEPFPLMRNDTTRVYIAQSGLIGLNGPDGSGAGRPTYSTAQTEYFLETGELAVDLLASINNVNITKRFIFSAEDYLVRVQYLVDNNSAAPWAANMFGQIKRDASEDPSNAGGFTRTFLGAVMTTPNDPYFKADFEDIDDGVDAVVMTGGWIGFSQHYFLSSWVPDAAAQNTFTARRNNNGEYLIGYVGPQVVVQPGQQTTIDSAFWAGPKDQYRLEEISPNLGKTIDYGKLWFVGYPIFWILTNINDLVGNFGLAIVLLTVVIRLLFLPLSAKQFDSQARMKKLQPKINQLKDRYSDDKQKFVQAQMELWKKEKVNPFSGCLPVLLQMPVFLGIYWVLVESVELRQASFILWYEDLSAMDPFFVLPLLLGAAYFFQQQLTPMPTSDPAQAKMMKWMPAMFTVFFLWFPAGLVLYYLANALLSIAQQWYFMSKIAGPDTNAKST